MEPTTLHERVAAADPGLSRQGPPAYRPGNPTWDAGYETARLQAAGLAATAGCPHMRILAMRPAPPVMPPAPAGWDSLENAR